MDEPKYAPLPPRGETPAALENTPRDALFAAVFFVLGWLFWELQVFSQTISWRTGTPLFTLLYAAAVLAYLFSSGRVPPAESWFWLAVMLLLGLSYLLPWGGGLLDGVQYIALLAAASYWPLAAGGRLYRDGRTSNWLFFDAMNAFFLLPWGNFGRLVAAPFGVWRARRRARGAAEPGRRAAVWAGVAAAVLCLCLVLPQLMAADDGFAAMFLHFSSFFDRFSGNFLEFTVRFLLALPTACYLYGLVYGSVRGRRASLFSRGEICAAQAGMRFVPRVTVTLALGTLAAVYVLFIAMQARVLFGGFFGILPEGFTYAGYARQGFFELCRVSAINAALLIAANVLCRDGHGLRVYNGAIAALTLLLLATAAAKMALYIHAYGLTEKRVLASTGLLWLAIVFLCVLIRQFRPVQLVRAAVLTGAVLVTLLCCLPIGDGVARWNARVEARQAAGALRLPAASDISEVTLTGEEGGAVLYGARDIEALCTLMDGREKCGESIQDAPVNADGVIEIVLEAGSDNRPRRCLYAYARGGLYYLEQPYNGVYRLTGEEYAQIAAYL